MAMTYAPLEGEAAARGLRSVMGGSWSVRHVMIHELSQVTFSIVIKSLEGEYALHVGPRGKEVEWWRRNRQTGS